MTIGDVLGWLAELEEPDAPKQRHDALVEGGALEVLGAVAGLDLAEEKTRRELTGRLVELRDRGWVEWDGDAATSFRNLRITVAGHAERVRRSSDRTSAARRVQEQRGADELRDAFLSHASEDKPFVRDLAAALRRRGCTVWFDEAELTVGDSLYGSIESGLARSRFGVVVISHAFLSKDWTQRELRGMAAKEIAGRVKVILPVWHGISAAEIGAKAPMLADLYAVSSAEGVESVADRIARAIDRDRGAERAVSGAPTPARRAWRLGHLLGLAIALFAGFDAALAVYLIVR